MEYLNAKKKKVATTSNESSQAKKMFLLGLLPELEPMTDTQMRLFRRKVLQLIDEIVSLPPETSNLLVLYYFFYAFFRICGLCCRGVGKLIPNAIGTATPYKYCPALL